MFAPLQLLVDRKKDKSISLPRKALFNTCSSMLVAHSLLERASDVPGPSDVIDKLANSLSENKKIEKPHPLWTSRHDAVLIGAIAKHGWPGQKDRYDSVNADDTLQWGAPFDGKEVELLVETACVAADFLNSEPEMLGDLEGFDQSQVMDSYGLIQ